MAKGLDWNKAKPSRPGEEAFPRAKDDPTQRWGIGKHGKVKVYTAAEKRAFMARRRP